MRSASVTELIRPGNAATTFPKSDVTYDAAHGLF